MTSKGWKPVNIRDEVLEPIEKRAEAEDRSVANVVERILTGAAKPVKVEVVA